MIEGGREVFQLLSDSDSDADDSDSDVEVMAALQITSRSSSAIPAPSGSLISMISHRTHYLVPDPDYLSDLFDHSEFAESGDIPSPALPSTGKRDYIKIQA